MEEGNRLTGGTTCNDNLSDGEERLAAANKTRRECASPGRDGDDYTGAASSEARRGEHEYAIDVQGENSARIRSYEAVGDVKETRAGASR